MKPTKLVYLRVSKKNDKQDEITQWNKLKERYNLKENECKIIKERISAYNEDLESKRQGLKLLRQEILSKEYKELYVFELSRLYRRMVKLFHFYFFCQDNGIKVYSLLQSSLENIEVESPIDQYMLYSQVLLHGYIAEDESYRISNRTKKSFVKGVDGKTYSKEGNKVGKKELSKDIINQIIDLRLEGYKYIEIKEELNSKGINISLGKISEVLNNN